ncbi:hypothetical protein Tco_0408757 [Tanacetum coccineum]
MIPQVHSPQSYSPMNAPPHLSQLQISHSSFPPSQPYQSYMDHQTSYAPQIAYHSPQVSTQPMIEFPQLHSSLAIPMFTQGYDTISCHNKAMAFLSVVSASKFPSTNNQLRTSSNSINQANIQDNRVVQQVQGRQGQSYAGTSYKGNATNEVQLAFLANLGIPDGQATQTPIPKNAAFQMEDLDAYDFDYIILEVPHSKPYHNNMDNQSVHAMQGFEQSPVVDFPDNEITSDSNIILYSQYLKETQQAAIQDTNFTREKMIDSQMDDMNKEKLIVKQQIDSLEQNLFNQIKEKESLLQTFTVFRNESKEKEMHMLTKPQVFYDDTHKQALGYQNPFYLKKAQRIKPTLYDGSIISSQHVVIPVIDDEKTLILEENKIFGYKLHTLILTNLISPVKIAAPRELPNVSLTLKDIFNVFDIDLLNEVTKVQTVFNQMEAAVQQCFVDKQCFEIHKKDFFLDIDRLLHQIMSQDVMLTVMNSTTIVGDFVNVEIQSIESYDKCFDLDAELLK